MSIMDSVYETLEQESGLKEMIDAAVDAVDDDDYESELGIAVYGEGETEDEAEIDRDLGEDEDEDVDDFLESVAKDAPQEVVTDSKPLKDDSFGGVAPLFDDDEELDRDLGEETDETADDAIESLLNLCDEDYALEGDEGTDILSGNDLSEDESDDFISDEDDDADEINDEADECDL